jgi:hypothetical protein
MRLLGTASRSLHLSRRQRSFRSAPLNHWHICCWIPFFSLCATRPLAAWSFQLESQRRPLNIVTNLAAIMPSSTRSTRSSSSKIEASKETAIDLDESTQKIPRKRARKSEEDQEEPTATSSKTSSSKKKKTITSKAKGSPKSTAKKVPATKTKGTATISASSANDDASVTSTDSKGKAKKKKSPTKKTKSPTKKKASDHQRITERDEIPKLWDAEKALADGSYS